jgi:hypothetical protein
MRAEKYGRVGVETRMGLDAVFKNAMLVVFNLGRYQVRPGVIIIGRRARWHNWDDVYSVHKFCVSQTVLLWLRVRAPFSGALFVLGPPPFGGLEHFRAWWRPVVSFRLRFAVLGASCFARRSGRCRRRGKFGKVVWALPEKLESPCSSELAPKRGGSSLCRSGLSAVGERAQCFPQGLGAGVPFAVEVEENPGPEFCVVRRCPLRLRQQITFSYH